MLWGLKLVPLILYRKLYRVLWGLKQSHTVSYSLPHIDRAEEHVLNAPSDEWSEVLLVVIGKRLDKLHSEAAALERKCRAASLSSENGN